MIMLFSVKDLRMHHSRSGRARYFDISLRPIGSFIEEEAKNEVKKSEGQTKNGVLEKR
jgi:hypothetical protein